ncbi:MAG TPA: biosynthetic-type acetolactate synthase large subunit [Anaerolineae bacterium]|nr:biosynthetic-type acetolactate synthase large subunit [Anaerolineae bacterium]HQH39472.1 biosynthetic-type acetolactate synthase large subunit [Anaerolineae bacterium]
MKKTGAEIVWAMLEHEGVEVVFGIPGGTIMHTYHPRRNYGVYHVLVRHEQCAAHAADGYARASGKVGVAIATSGPGATNLVTGIATAMMDSSPIVCITGQVATPVIGTDAFQEVDITGITLPITKHNYLVTDLEELPEVIHEAFYIARSGRPGPVLIDLPKDVQQAAMEFVFPDDEVHLRGYHPVGKGDPAGVKQAAALINQAERPVILAGQGVIMSGAMEALRAFAEKTDTPVAFTLLGKGGFPESHPLALALMGMHGEVFVNRAIQEADLLLALGMRFDDRVTGRLDAYAPHARKIHIDMDVAELNKIVRVDVPIRGDLRQVLEQLLPLVSPADHAAWRERIDGWRAQSHKRDIINRPENGHLAAPHFINAIWEATGGQAIVVTDVGQHQMWVAQYYPTDYPRSLITSGGQGTMGFGLPAAIGAQIARPDKEVWAIVGDGGFQMTMHDLATVVQEKLPLRIAISNNHYLGMVRQWQEFFYDKNYEATHLWNPDFVKLAEAYGIRAWRAANRRQARLAIAEAHAHDGPALIEFEIAGEGDEANVYPMVPTGAALHEMIERPTYVATDAVDLISRPEQGSGDLLGAIL